YVAALLVGSTLWTSETILNRILSGDFLKYIATISYALYVVHPLTMYGWLDEGLKIELYFLKRPISFALTFLAAHMSTFYYEKRWIKLGKKLTQHKPAQEAAAIAPTPVPID
ncbi:MAG TPA: hypothetical protein VG722_03315, partial [Tepidisphaeraceae bacterium]|nr:hypothetical protein [Tepidisphaeraceae bacterium]